MALIQGQGFTSLGAQTVVDNFAVEFDRFDFAVAPPAGSVAASVEQTLFSGLKTAPVVNNVTVSVGASMPAAATIAGAAEVRAAQGDPSSSSTALIVDFQALRTVSELVGTAVIVSVAPWLGTKFDDNLDLTWSVDQEAVTFQEVQTERLLVTFQTNVSPAVLAANGAVVIPTPPSNLELLVNGTRAWFKSGPVSNPYTETGIDVTAAVSAAAASGDAVVTLRAAAPAALTLAVTATLLQRYVVAFPEGATRTVDAPTEGVYPLSLPISTTSVVHADPSGDGPGPDTWLVKGVVLDVTAKISTVRVQPADGPSLSGDAVVVLDPDHALVVRLPPAATGSIAAVTGLRLFVTVGDDGAELAGTLRANAKVNDEDAPGDPLPKGALGPVTLAGSSTPGWVDLALTMPQTLSGAEVVWVELQVARGSLIWTLAEISNTDADNAELRRRTSSGKYVKLSALAGIPDYAGALRVVGQEKANDPLAAVQVAVAGGTDFVAGVPTQAGTTMNLGIGGTGVVPSPLAGGDDREVPLELTIATPGSYAITSAELQYTQP